MEIVLVDDGSTDLSRKIADEYAKKEDRIKVIHQENEGASAARNPGLEIAQGEYIAFLDSDDWIKESGLKFVTQLTEEDTAIYSDNSYFYRICQNLVENALKYSAKGTRVFIKTYKKEAGTDQKMVLEITNTSGYEMDFEKEDIIERFSRGDKARTSEGNGLGLAIVSTYAKALGGEFDIKIDCDQFKAIVSI